MKKQYVSPACEVVSVSIDAALMAASTSSKMSLNGGVSDIAETEEEVWSGSKATDLDWED